MTLKDFNYDAAAFWKARAEREFQRGQAALARGDNEFALIWLRSASRCESRADVAERANG